MIHWKCQLHDRLPVSFMYPFMEVFASPGHRHTTVVILGRLLRYNYPAI